MAAQLKDSNIYDMAYRGETAAVKILLNENEKLKTQTDSNGRMLLHWSALGGHEDLVRYLLSLGVPADPQDDAGMTPLILAASAGRDKVVKLLINADVEINKRTDEGHSALQYASSKNWITICESLIEKGGDINIADKRGATPLHRAASKGNIAIVKLLLNQGNRLNIDQVDIYGNSALHLACEEDRREEAKLLVSHSANIDLKNKEQKTPLDVAGITLARQIRELKETIVAN